MDSLTHIFLPYAAYTWLGRPRRERVAAAVGGAAPDMDALWAWASHVHPYAYPLVHRGFSHTLWGAPLLATLLLWTFSRPALARRWSRMAAFEWHPEVLGPLWIGAFSHIFLDGLTITGVPLLWPFNNARYTFDWFFFSVPYLIPLSLWPLVQLLRRKATDRSVRAWSVIVLLVLLAAAGSRLAARPIHVPSDAIVTPSAKEWEWYVSIPSDEGVVVQAVEWGRHPGPSQFFETHNETAAAPAIIACQRTVGYVPWMWDLWGIPVVDAQGTTEGGWKVRFADSARLFSESQGSFRMLRSPASRESDFSQGATCVVTPDGQAEFERDRGFLGS